MHKKTQLVGVMFLVMSAVPLRAQRPIPRSIPRPARTYEPPPRAYEPVTPHIGELGRSVEPGRAGISPGRESITPEHAQGLSGFEHNLGGPRREFQVAASFRKVRNDARADAGPKATAFAKTIKRKDWSFVRVYHWEPPTNDTGSVVDLRADQGLGPARPVLRDSDLLGTKRALEANPSTARLSETQIRAYLDLNSAYPFPPRDSLALNRPLYSPVVEEPIRLESIPSMAALAKAADRAIVYSPKANDIGVDTTAEATAIKHLQGEARFVIVEGARSLQELTQIPGHIVRIHGEVSGDALQRTMDILDRFMASFTEPNTWSGQTLVSKATFLQVRTKQEELLVLVNLAASAKQGRIVSSVYQVKANSKVEQQQLEDRIKKVLKVIHGQRVYVSGDALTSINLDESARAEDIELVHRDLSYQKPIAVTEQRLIPLQNRKLDPKTLTLVNGLPSTPEAVDALGPFAGDAEQWMQFRAKLDKATGHIARPAISTKEDFFRELTEGQDDILILVAHADGNTVYFDGKEITLEELQRLNNRTKPSTRPRLAILLSCNAGAQTTSVPAWRRWFFSQKQSLSLANILVRKGFVDRVIAPNRTINARETVSTIQALLNGTSTNPRNLGHGFVNWANIRRPRYQGYEG